MNNWMRAGLLGCLILAGTAQAQERTFFHRRAFLQCLTSSSVKIVSQSAEPVIASIEYGLQGEERQRIVETKPAHDHIFELTDLEPGTCYTYQVAHGEARFDEVSFTTLPGRDGSFTFAVIGDSGSLSPAQISIAQLIRQESPDLLLHTGDVVYPAGSDVLYQRNFFDVYADTIESAGFYPSLGNHDCLASYAPWRDAFVTPANNDEGLDDYYSFDAGDVHIACLNTCEWRLPEVQSNWLEQDLLNTDRTWKIVFFHHAVYSNGFHNGHLAIRDGVVPVIEAADVDLVLTGHEHIYERFYPIRENTIIDAYQSPNYVNPRGATYVVSGGGGARLYGFRESPDWTKSAKFEATHHALFAEVTPTRLTMRAVTAEGVEFDRFTITKGEGRPDFVFIRGDADSSGNIDVSDAISILSYLFLGRATPCFASADVDDSGRLTIADAIRVLQFLFHGAQQPAAPYPDCGVSDDADDRGCLPSCDV